MVREGLRRDGHRLLQRSAASAEMGVCLTVVRDGDRL
jgi:hypothetical protein